MEHRCQCCNTINTRSKCGYCGFTEIIGMDQDGNNTANQLAVAHKHAMRKCIRDISVVTYQYQWNAAASCLKKKKEEVLRLANGEDCITVFWSKDTFGQTTPDKEIHLKLSYNYELQNGSKTEHTCEARIKPVACDDFWKIGLLIDSSLHLKVYLGTEKQYAVSESVQLEFR